MNYSSKRIPGLISCMPGAVLERSPFLSRVSPSVCPQYENKGLIQDWPLSLQNITPFKCFTWDASEKEQRSPQMSRLALDIRSVQ